MLEDLCVAASTYLETPMQLFFGCDLSYYVPKKELHRSLQVVLRNPQGKESFPRLPQVSLKLS